MSLIYCGSCEGDIELAAEITSLVKAFEGDSEFLNEPVMELSMAVLAGRDIKPTLNGQKIGTYAVKEKLGGGGMGEVYLACDTILGRQVALKFLTNTFLEDNWARRQLVREAQAVAKLDHPNICPVYGFEEIGEHRFIVMQFIKGVTLSRLIREKQIRQHEILPMAQQIVDAIAAAHADGIIHRDIKPGNIMLTAEGNVKVLDFGLAKIIHDKNRADVIDDKFSQWSQNGLVMGTVVYMSPEQLKTETLDYRSDIFSLGTVLFELATGQHPFEQKSDAETISAILSPVSPLDGQPSRKMDASLRRIVRRCLEKEKERRYSSTTELLVDLQNQTESPTQERFGPKIASITALVLFIALIASVFLYFRTGGLRTIVVLPFRNESAEGGLEFVSSGIAESLTERLSSNGRFLVVPFTEICGVEDTVADPAKIGRHLKADLVLTGTISDKVIGRR